MGCTLSFVAFFIALLIAKSNGLAYWPSFIIAFIVQVITYLVFASLKSGPTSDGLIQGISRMPAWKGLIYSNLNAYISCVRKGYSHKESMRIVAKSRFPLNSFVGNKLILDPFSANRERGYSYDLYDIKRTIYDSLRRVRDPELAPFTELNERDKYKVYGELKSALTTNASIIEEAQIDLGLFIMGVFSNEIGWPPRGKERVTMMVADELAFALRMLGDILNEKERSEHLIQ